MNPFLSIALSLLPDLVSALEPDEESVSTRRISRVIKSVTGATDPEKIRAALEHDRELEVQLTLALAKLNADLQAKRLNASVKQAENARQDAMARLDRHLADQREARSAFSTLASSANPFAWGPVAVSMVVTLGFFGILAGLLVLWQAPVEASNREAFQLLNIAIGALTAGFATVISFWLGSSQGSRAKDAALATPVRQPFSSPSQQLTPLQHSPQQLSPQQLSPQPASFTPPATQERFDACVEIVLSHEGGYVDHPQDPGGATNFGITLATLRDWRGDLALSAEDVKALSRTEAKQIYRARYWQALSCDQLPAGLDLMLFDFGVNAGPGRAARLLQRLVGAAEDGVIGPRTLAATTELATRRLINAYADARLAYYRGLSHFSSFGRGWTNRTEAVRSASLGMVID
ncbi:glycoside hydrolase family 108 protein [Pseudovibrio exalbescens]|uniref:glycoside hydrolase family 108 protein n=1 Tax=Pseudovibrio exalbescens TaxID=197461 RepID=UPI002366FA6E|nr:glycoside hydrolase family 108 protein [Pseudovibrio exalbescens]MDD7910878.1 glycoside hydrolase family 108 protein [Pseudovibrio exalbescens]